MLHRHTLWKRIQTVVTPLLAQIISVIDRDCNLNLLRDDTPLFVRNLWMNIFNDANLLDLPYNRTIFRLVFILKGKSVFQKDQNWLRFVFFCFYFMNIWIRSKNRLLNSSSSTTPPITYWNLPVLFLKYSNSASNALCWGNNCTHTLLRKKSLHLCHK